MAPRCRAFLESFPPVAELPYLPDVARLELALRRSYHAADGKAFDASILQSLSPDQLMSSRLTLAPAVETLTSRFPVHAIWLANTQDDAPKPVGGGQNMLLSRPEFDPSVDLIPLGACAFIDALLNSTPFGEAVAAAEAIDPNHDLGATLGLLLSRNAISTLIESRTP